MTDLKGNPRKISLSLYLTAFLISAIIFAAGIYTGKLMEQSNINSLSAKVDAANMRASSLELMYLSDDSPEFCPVYQEELFNLDSEVESIGYRLSYMEDTKGITDAALKKKYFMLEAQAFLLSQKVREKCGANYSTLLYFYSNSNCTTCKQQGIELLEVKKELGEKIRIYSFDGDLGSAIVDALKAKYNVMQYPSIVVNKNRAIGGLKNKQEVLALLR